MEEKKNISVGGHQQLMNIESSIDRIPSEALKKALLGLNLLLEDFEKSGSLLNQIENFVSFPLESDMFRRKVMHLIESIKIIAERAIENHQYLADNLEDVYRQTVELEKAIGETHESIDVRFTFWLHMFGSDNPREAGMSRKISTFSEFLNSLVEKHSSYAYFLAPFGSTPLLICRYLPLDANLKHFESDTLQFSAYVASPTGSLQSLKRAWNKLFKSPNKSVFHLFRNSRTNASIGTFKQRSSIRLQPYRPHRYNEPDQLPKIVYDFINLYGISGRRRVHLLKGDDKWAVFTTQRPIQFDGRFIQLSDADDADESPQDLDQQLIE